MRRAQMTADDNKRPKSKSRSPSTGGANAKLCTTMASSSSLPPLKYLAPFFATVALSYTFYVPMELEDAMLGGMVLKCMPILSLMLFMCLTSRDRARQYKNEAIPEKQSHKSVEREMVFTGLVFSIIGDGLLVWENLVVLFLSATVVFGVVHILYVRAFGFKHVSILTGGVVFGFGALALLYFVPIVPAPMKMAMPGYGGLIGTMLWRAIDRALFNTEVSVERRACTVLGAFLFCVSDLSLITFRFVLPTVSYPVTQAIILASYYSSQMFIVLGSA